MMLVVHVLSIRPFGFQKVLLITTKFILGFSILEPGYAYADNHQNLHPEFEQAEQNAGLCSPDSIKQKQQLFKPDASPIKFSPSGLEPVKNKNTSTGISKILNEVTYKIVGVTPHDTSAYTQGLVFFNGYLFEGTGGLGLSEVKKIDLKTGQVIQSNTLPSHYFGEGLGLVNKRLIQLTLKKNLAFIYDTDNLRLLDRFNFSGDGWGIIELNKKLLISNGSSLIQQIDRNTYQLIEKKHIMLGSNDLEGINEMENVNGMIFANIWPTDCIAIINPSSFQVLAWINLSALFPENKRPNSSAILNGIAYDSKQNTLFVTGKYWPKIYHLKLNKLPNFLN